MIRNIPSQFSPSLGVHAAADDADDAAAWTHKSGGQVRRHPDSDAARSSLGWEVVCAIPLGLINGKMKIIYGTRQSPQSVRRTIKEEEDRLRALRHGGAGALRQCSGGAAR